jgi:hypothetical protein
VKYAYLFLSCIVTQIAYGQSITGRILEEDKPLALVNVMLLGASDSALKFAAITDANGTYLFETVKHGSYILSASRVGYQTQYVPSITVDGSRREINLPVMRFSVASKELKQVTIMGKRPFVEQKIDRMVVNVANSIIASGTTALEVLEKAPGVIIDRQNEQIMFRGKEGVIVQIDGKQTYLSMTDVVNLLRSMPSENIDRIELITNPSAKYDAAGNAGIIDIRLKKNNNIGTNGSLSVSGGSGTYARQRGSIQVNNRTAKLNLFGNYSINNDGNYWDFEIEKDQRVDGLRNYIDQDSYIRFKLRGHNAKAGVDYFLNKKTTLGIVWTGAWNTTEEDSPAEAVFREEKGGDVFFHTLTQKTLKNKQSNHVFNFNIARTIDKGQLSADIDFGRFRRQFNNELVTETLFPSSPQQPVANLLSDMPTTIDIVSGRADYSRTLNSGWKFDAGVKVSNVASDNDMKLSQGTNGTLVLDTALSNRFQYDETVYAAYASVGGKLNPRTDVLLGLRAEHTRSVANSITTNNVAERDYINVFPSVFLSRSINKNNSFTVSYSYRIDRPNYQLLNPVRSYLDPYAYSSGNSFLRPQYTHSFEAKHSYKNRYFTSIGASFINDLIFFLVQPIDENTTQRMPENIGSSEAYNVTMTFPVVVMKGWTMQNTLMGIYSHFSYTYKGTEYSVDQMAGRFNSVHAFILGKGWTGEMSGRLNTPAVNALFRSPWLGSLDVGIQKSFAKNWKAKLNFQDVFHTNMINGKINVPDFDSHIRIRMDTRVLMLNITYAFGNQQLKGARQRKIASEEEIQRTRE